MRSQLRLREQEILNGGAGTFLNRETEALVDDMMRASASRLKMAVFGALAFLIPMLIMILHPTKLTTLLTTVVCVLFVAVALSFAMHDSDGKDPKCNGRVYRRSRCLHRAPATQPVV
jgi:VIT1/CCC1 family predicted Fe2+/Mn2+ transporter